MDTNNFTIDNIKRSSNTDQADDDRRNECARRNEAKLCANCCAGDQPHGCDYDDEPIGPSEPLEPRLDRSPHLNRGDNLNSSHGVRIDRISAGVVPPASQGTVRLGREPEERHVC